jgi:hypothetical protein
MTVRYKRDDNKMVHFQTVPYKMVRYITVQRYKMVRYRKTVIPAHNVSKKLFYNLVNSTKQYSTALQNKYVTGNGNYDA